MTNNGDIINRMMRAANKHEKEYKVTVDKPVTDEFLKEMAGGVPILDTVTRPCQVEKLGKYKFKIILTQGLNRQIRRMCEVLGYEVKELRRVRIMNIELGNLKPGEYRKVTDQELNELYELIRIQSQSLHRGTIIKSVDLDMDKMKRMQELVELLNKAGKAYYQDAQEIMSNYEYDALYDELKGLEEELGTVMASSPTVNVGYEVLSELPKERHESPMLSLDKTKEVTRLKEFVGDQTAVISWKMDGLTIVLTYRDGELFKAVTRGNGEVGEVITNNAKVFKNVPLHIPYKGELILRGEAVIGYKDFERINEEIDDVDAKYKNPRNLCSGSVRQLNNKITAQRNVKFYAFTLVRAENVDFHNSRKEQLDWLEHQGFDVVEHYLVTREELDEKVAFFCRKDRRK